MAEERGMSRRRAIGIGAATLAGTALSDVLVGPADALAAGTRDGIGYFARFGVTEGLIREALSTALRSGGDHADLFFQHRVTNQ